MKRSTLKSLLKEIVKESLVEMGQDILKDDRVKFDVDPKGGGVLIAKYNNQDVGKLIPDIPPTKGLTSFSDSDFYDDPGLYTFEALDERFKPLHDKRGTLKLLKINLIRLIDIRIEKRH